ncbi:hypothetical protein I3842_04G176600 [Carya illinoinensis]|uniref:Uncharacterized protein n=1 Tax=Carya illinoinensis TaxID=32201 RepID=A0A922JSH2_CARIL|nr:hypothetical protein I3842_04G176600 [Carya illinoinensis]
MAKLKIGGTWAGVIEVVLEEWTVPMLRIESINLICAVKVLRDGNGTEKLAQLGVKNNARILASRGSVEEGKSLEEGLLAEEERSRRLSRVNCTAPAKRHADGSLPVEDFNIEVKDQSGQIVQLGSETDQRAVMMGLMLHANGKQLIRSENYKDALEVLTMGEEAFSLCNPKLIDNVPMMQIDMVWCYFMLRDIRWLSVAGARLEKAREGIEHAHGKDYSHVRLLQAGCHPELAIHLTLELLEGVVAYHNGEFDRSRKALTSAHAKYFQFWAPRGGGECERQKRSDQIDNQDVGSAVDFLVEEKAKRAQKREEDIRRRTEIMEQKKYGMTPSKKAVDLNKLNELTSIGFSLMPNIHKHVHGTNTFILTSVITRLDNLTDPEANSALQVDIESRKRKRTRQASETAIEQLVGMGFERSRVVIFRFISLTALVSRRAVSLETKVTERPSSNSLSVALHTLHDMVAALQAGATIEQAMHQLLSQSDSNPTVGADNSANSSAPILPDMLLAAVMMLEDHQRLVKRKRGMPRWKMQAKGDALTDYDIEVTNKGEAINEYLALLESAGNSVEASRP